ASDFRLQQATRSLPDARSLLPRVSPHQLALGERLGLQRLQNRVALRSRLELERCGQRIDFEVVAVVAATWGTRTAVADLPKIVRTLTGAVAERALCGHAFGERFGCRRYVVDEPVIPVAGRRVGIVHDNGEALGGIGRAFPMKRRGAVRSVAGV